jgi:hypothetical protein
MNRRDFLKGMALVGSAAALAGLDAESSLAGGDKISWQRNSQTGLFTGVSAEGVPLVARPDPGLLLVSCRPAGGAATAGPLRVTVEHRLRSSASGHGEDVLEATLTVRNASNEPQSVTLDFATSAQPSPRVHQQRVYVPLSAAGLFGDGRFAALGVKNFFKDCDQAVGAEEFECHYLEPAASFPEQRQTRALLLAPVVDINHPRTARRVALFTPSDQPMRFSHRGGVWRAGRQVTVPAGGSLTQRCWLMIHSGDASVAWRAFHRFAHREEFPAVAWAREMKVHYMDILRPDAIVVDETFAGLGYDHHADRSGATSAGAIDFYRRLRGLVRSFGPDKAFFTSDCSMSPFVLWADGECGDHAYPGLLGDPLYTQEPVRYLAALGDKPWRPCAWDFQKMWPAQVKLARQMGAGVGVSNGWIQYTGLTRLPEAVRRQMIADIDSIP